RGARGILFASKVLIWPADTFTSTPIKQKTEGAMHISQRSLRSFVICFAILMLLPVAGTAIVGTGIVTLPLFFFTNTGALSCKPGDLWFGKVMVGGSNVLSARLSNTGTSNITISSLILTHPW